MFKVERLDKGNIIGQSKIRKKDIPKLYNFCRQFDLSKIDLDATEVDSNYVFDVRRGVIHWIDKESKTIKSSFYCDMIKGEVRIEMGNAPEWTSDIVIEKWKEVVATAMESGL